MAIALNRADLEKAKFKESTVTANQAGIVVVNPDGSNIGSGSTSGLYAEDTVFSNGSSLSLVGVEIDDPTALSAMTEGDVGNLKGDLSGRLITSLGTQIAGEDLSANVLKTEVRCSRARATADALLVTGAGWLHTITLSPLTATPTAGLLTIYDSLTETGTPIYREWVFITVPGKSITLDVTFGTGIYVGFDATLANIECGISYRQ